MRKIEVRQAVQVVEGKVPDSPDGSGSTAEGVEVELLEAKVLPGPLSKGHRGNGSKSVSVEEDPLGAGQ